MKSNNRYLGAAMIAPFIVFVFLGGIYLKCFIFALSAMALWEFYNALKENDLKPMRSAGYILLIIYYLLNNNFENMMYVVVAATFILLIFPVINLKYTFIDTSLTLLGFIYCGILFSFVYLVNVKAHGEFLVWIIFIGSWLSDTAAFYSGKLFGKHKLSPKVSPKKTIEGSIGGLVGATVFTGIFGMVVQRYVNIMPIYNYFIIGILCGLFGQLGDLVASSIKRYVGVKDYSNLIPGHGGVLDRFDSIIFAAAAVFYYLTFIIKI
ncbi:phosphatidate cytidylyltransferase [Clostridium beijerinckii]|uniref:Phosphatidate cytidylyltransferase n=1 Tax=Clostridium beijerinckii TaxID=1520 RepID=A0A9Q5CLF4_CLOBE|nr:phosphatidate cytidylyltransferase [Clostridium beijerinckii]AQS03839.1 phosphatidate cytidylyltransferase [Clostridium beijerinckii]MBA2885165.1 phosphatidate cytidylyltransferase [Clostridium beijerinckii]MBA2899887.1 phosphatidate cytidylyltransferase [Clostridium beijerinckii]MBA2909516.1 phosphatidate cytidylyltransferase [Clostridium beijerinckii]MBA9016615.1 phosphatidate cytidylyltransferase [Clostridium beijerinckii]